MPVGTTTPLNSLIKTLDDRRRALLDELASLSADVLGAKPGPGKWSMLEIIEHLVVAERVILRGLPPPGELVAQPCNLRNRCLYLLVLCILRFRIPVKVPSRRMLPTGDASLAELRGRWDENQAWLRSYAEGLGPTDDRKAVFTHPVAGPITLAQALRLDLLHLEIHRRQIQKLQQAKAS